MQKGSSLPVRKLRDRVDEVVGFMTNLKEKYRDDWGFMATALLGDGS